MLLRIARVSALINPDISPFSSDSNQSNQKFKAQISLMYTNRNQIQQIDERFGNQSMRD